MKTIYILFFFFSISIFAKAGDGTPGVYKDSATGIPISFVTDKEMFPESWRGGDIDGEAESLDKTEYKRMRQLMKKVLAKYPVEVLKANLVKIYVLKKIEFYEVEYGGTNSNDRVYITNQGLLNNYSDQYIEQVFHAEFSSILLRNFPQFLSEADWTAINPDDFTYGGEGYIAIRDGKASEDYDSTLNADGFLNQYATSNFENDLNSFAKNIFAADEGFWDLCFNYEGLEKKLNLAIAFYAKINAAFTLEAFKEMD